MFLLPWIAFFVVAYLTNDTALILIGSIIRVSFAVAVVVTFTPAVYDIALGRKPMNRGSWIAYGVWWGWSSVAYSGIETLTWRLIGQPMWLVNSDVTSAGIFMAIIGGVAHIVRPGDLNEHLPRREMIRVGLLTGAATAVGLTIIYLPEIRSAWAGGPTSWMPPRMELASPLPVPSAKPDQDAPL